MLPLPLHQLAHKPHIRRDDRASTSSVRESFEQTHVLVTVHQVSDNDSPAPTHPLLAVYQTQTSLRFGGVDGGKGPRKVREDWLSNVVPPI